MAPMLATCSGMGTKPLPEAYAAAMGDDPAKDAEFVIAHRWYKHVKQGITNL